MKISSMPMNWNPYYMVPNVPSFFDHSYLDQFCFWGCAESGGLQNPHFQEKPRSSDAVSTKKEKGKASNKELFKPLIIKKASEALQKLVEEFEKNSNSWVKDEVVFEKADKSANPPGHVPKKQRANFIGVSKNGANWQSLIVINNVKVYLGTYKTQEEAARTFDFHSMVVKYKSARVNYDYTARDFMKMIEIFDRNNNEFIANLYLTST
jgi:hypothetical protein